mgnify:CR=1 FL=1
MYQRFLQPLVEELLNEFRVLYITGPRQAGKTTLVRAIAAQQGLEYHTLDDQTVLESAQSDPHGFVRSFGSKRVILDEFQYAPTLIPAIKEASDLLGSSEKGKFLLTGSADIFRSGRAQEALPGHMARLELFPLSMGELRGDSFNTVDYLLSGGFQSGTLVEITRQDIAKLILNGGYPEVQAKSTRAKQIWFKSYMEGRLYKDFETLYAARGDYYSKIQALAPYLAGLCGNLLKYSSIGNALELDDRVVKNYIEILDLMFIVRRVPAWLKNRAKRQATQMPKGHFIDTGLACHLLGLRNEEQLLKSQYYGGLLENLIFMELSKQTSWSEEVVELYHFRDKRKHEVDIVLEKSNGSIIGIEVKASATIRSEDFKALAKLAEFAGNKLEHGIVFYTGNNILPFDYQGMKFHAIPVSLFLGKPG